MFKTFRSRFRDLLLFSGRNRPPFKSKAPRRAGQTLEEKLDDCLEAVSIGLTMAAVGIAGLAAFALSANSAVLTFSVVAAVGASVAAWTLPKAINVSKGLAGEREVGAILDELERNGAFVIHDLPADGFNIDHVVISSQGIFAIETKYMAKRKNSDHKLLYDGGVLTRGGAPLEFDPRPQALAAAAEVKRILRSTGVDQPVTPVVVFPGWFVTQGFRAREQPWVLAPKALAGWLEKEPARMSHNQSAELAGLLFRYASVAA